MISPFKLTFAAALLGFLVSPTAGRGGDSGRSLSFVIPPDRSLVSGSSINVVVTTAGSAVDQVGVAVNGRKPVILHKPVDRYYICATGLTLSAGLNRITVTGFRNGRKVEEISRQVVRKSPLNPDDDEGSSGTATYRFHGDPLDRGCRSCHTLDFRATTDKGGAARRSPCFTCHRTLVEKDAFVHGPAAVWACLSCHDPSSPRLATPLPSEKLCRSCHDATWEGKHRHGPSGAGNCTACHDPHGSDQPLFLRAAPGELCTGCHEDVLSRPHILSGFAGEGHPLRKNRDPSNPQRELTCISCHNPHAASSPSLLNGYDGRGEIQRFCRRCHVM